MLSRAFSMPFDWTDDAVGTLKKLWAQGLTAAQIADDMGGGLSRSAVLGKVRRLKLKARQSPTTTLQERSAAGRALAAAQRGTKPIGRPRKITVDTSAFEADPLPEEELGNDVTSFLGVTRDKYRLSQHCSYGLGDPRAANFRFCGDPLHAGSHWCERHYHLVYPGAQS